MIYVITNFAFFMIPYATEGSFEFNHISSEEARNILKENKYEVYISEKEKDIADAIRKDLGIKFIRRTHVHAFYDNTTIILIQNKSKSVDKFEPKYFYCTIHSNGSPPVYPRSFAEQ